MADLVSNLQASFSTLSKREQRMVAFGGIAAGIFLVFMVTFSFGQKADSIRRTTELKTRKLEDVLTLASGYRETKSRQDALEAQLAASNVKLISYMEDKAKAAGIELPTINPRPDVALDGTKIVESSVEVTLTDVKLNLLLDFLSALEAGPGIVKIKYMRLEPHATAENLTAFVTIATYHTKG